MKLQVFNIVRIWIRGETNILADAPSRAPADVKTVRNLPVPNMELKDLLRYMYQEPEEFERLVQERAKTMGLDTGVEVPATADTSDSRSGTAPDDELWGAEAVVPDFVVDFVTSAGLNGLSAFPEPDPEPTEATLPIWKRVHLSLGVVTIRFWAWGAKSWLTFVKRWAPVRS